MLLGMSPHLPFIVVRYSRASLCLVVLAQFLSVVETKYHMRELTLTNAVTNEATAWRYASKFGFAKGIGVLCVRLRVLDGPAEIPDGELPHVGVRLEVYFDETWPAAEAMQNACERYTHAKLSPTMAVNKNGAWSEWANNSISQSIRPHVWYLAVSSCGQGEQGTHRIAVEMVFQQEGGLELSYENRWSLTINAVALFVFGCFSVHVCLKAVKFRQSNGSLHPVIATLTSAIALQIVGHIVHTWHLWRYYDDGVGMPKIEVSAEIFFTLSQVSLAALLIMIAMGYTLTKSRVGDLDLIIVVSGIVALLHVVLVVLGTLQDEDSFKFHKLEGKHGWLIFILRSALCLWFFWAVQRTSSSAGPALQSFLRGYLLAGSGYFLSYPVMFLVIRIFAQYLQNMILQAGLVAMQVASMCWLAQLFLSRGTYFEVSVLSRSGLPRRAKSVDTIDFSVSFMDRIRRAFSVRKADKGFS